MECDTTNDEIKYCNDSGETVWSGDKQCKDCEEWGELSVDDKKDYCELIDAYTEGSCKLKDFA